MTTLIRFLSNSRLEARRFALCLLLAAMAQSTNALEPEDDTVLRSFTPDYFTQYAPRTALEMVRRIAGFQLKGGDNQRGLGQGGANVLLNGQRLTGKSGDPFSQLERITAANVARIDIVDGAGLNIPGLSGDIANVITSSQSGASAISGTWKWEPQFRPRLEPNLYTGKLTFSGAKNTLSYSAELRNHAFRNGHRGPEERRLANGSLYETVYDDGQYYGEQPGGALSLTWKPHEAHIGNLTLEYNQFNFNRRTLSSFTAQTEDGINGEGVFTSAEDEWNGKIDGDYEFPLGPGALKLIGYYRAEHSPTLARYDLYDENTLIEQTRFSQTADEGEAIFRSEYSWQRRAGRSWQTSLEGAFNFLDIAANYQDLIAPENSERYDPVRVEENRAEANLTYTRTFSPKWDVQTSIGAEYSQITQGNLQREFVRPKGFISAAYKPQKGFNIRARIEREVGQLNFFDFISSVDLQDNFNQSSNANIVPDQSWVGELEFDRQFTDGHSLKLSTYARLISDLVDRIPIGEDGDGVGNIDSAYQYGLDISGTLKGEPFGIDGLQIDAELNLRNSSVDDPVEGFERRLNHDLTHKWEIELRHDIPKTDWAWGFGLFDRKSAPVYRLSIINDHIFDGPFASAFIEHKNILGMKANISFRNLMDASDDRARIIYAARRDLGEIESTRWSEREFDSYIRLSFSGTF